MRGRFLIALLLVATAVAGCSDSPSANQPTPEFDALELEATPTTGVIRGVVIDAAITPIADVVVRLTSGSLETVTNAEGLFGFENIEPGTHFIQVSKLGFKSTQASVDVIAGETEPKVLKVLVERDPTTTPFFVQHHYTGFISCGFKTANIVWNAASCDPAGTTGLSANDDSAPWFFIDAPPLYYQSEMLWKPTQTFSEQLVTIQWACNAESCGDDDFRLCNVRGPSPLVCRVTMDAGGGGGGLGINETKLGGENAGYQVAMFANCNPCVNGNLGLGVVKDQPFEVYNHLFYGYIPPADWTFVATSTVPGPP